MVNRRLSKCSPPGTPECKEPEAARLDVNAQISLEAIRKLRACGATCDGLSQQKGFEGLCGLLFKLPTDTFGWYDLHDALELSDGILTGKLDPQDHIPALGT